jgi:hypothetical protein
MRVVILQPGYLPWSGYFDQMNRADIFVHATNLQHTRQDWRSRNRIKTRKGWQWITVPVKSKGHYYARINEIRINNDIPWATSHMNLLRENYTRTPFFKEYAPFFEDTYSRRWKYLVDLDIHIINYLKDILGIKAKTADIADLSLGEVDRNTRIIRTCQKLGASTYLSGPAGQDYIKPDLFAEAGIDLEFQHYVHPVYPQFHGEFLPNMSVIDLLFNCGPKSLSILSKLVLDPTRLPLRGTSGQVGERE